jgi:CDP-diacylglycerol---glycerol-3-phosphate 3-phosphatidyltransferase
VAQVAEKKEHKTFTDQVRLRFGKILDPVAVTLTRLGLKPNTMTILGLAGNTLGAFLLSQGYMTMGGILILLMGPVDALDGTMARMRGEPTAFGAFVDSVSDRYSELIILGSLLFYYLSRGEQVGAMLAFAAASGSVLISYVRARAQSLGYETKVGILTRMERYLVLGPSLVVNLPLLGLWILAIFTHMTALQRILDVRRQVRSS